MPEVAGRIAARARQRADLGVIGLPKQKLTALVEIADRVDSKHVVTLEVQQQQAQVNDKGKRQHQLRVELNLEHIKQQANIEQISRQRVKVVTLKILIKARITVAEPAAALVLVTWKSMPLIMHAKLLEGQQPMDTQIFVEIAPVRHAVLSVRFLVRENMEQRRDL